MRHPDQQALALHAGGDLNALAAWRTRRHLAKCSECRAELAEFEAARAAATELADVPGISWNRLAVEMKANIRVGLAAGECVRVEDAPARVSPFFSPGRALAAAAGIALLVVASFVLQHPAPRNSASVETAGVQFQSTSHGVQVSEGGSTLSLLHAGTESNEVTYTPGAQGSMRASYVDSETSYVTVASVYAN